MKKRISGIKGYHFFYASFFVAYFFLIYFLLYHPNGLFPFQVNIHFFSNVIGSLSKRFLAETAPYALLFYLIFYSKRKWLRISLIAIFLLLFALNFSELYYYFATKTDVQFYVLRGIEWKLLLSYIVSEALLATMMLLAAMAALGAFLYRLGGTMNPALNKRIFFSILFVGLAFGGNYIPVVYSPHASLFDSDVLAKKQYRLKDLESPGIVTLLNEIQYEYFRPAPIKQALDANEQVFIDSLKLEERLTIESDFHPTKIVLIAVESLSQTLLSRYNEEIPNVTPFLDGLIENNPHIDEFYPSGTYTLFGLASILCSHTNTSMVQKDADYECLPNLLQKAGYWTEFIRGFSKYYVRENIFFDKIGYDTITALEEFDEMYPNFKNERPDLYDSWGFSDDYLFDEVIVRLKEKRDDSLFLTVLTVDTHVAGGRCYRERTKSDHENDVLFSVNCFDSVVKDFIKNLEAEGLFDDNLLIVLTADHLYPNYSSVPGNTEASGFTVKPGHIPLVFISKTPIDLIASRGSQIDLTPTFLDILDIEAPDYYMGKSLIANSDTIPMGQDRIYAYMLAEDNFIGLNLLHGITSTDTNVRSGDYMTVVSGNIEELELKIEQLKRENGMEWNADSTLLKWYENQM